MNGAIVALWTVSHSDLQLKIDEVVESEMRNIIEESILTLFESGIFRQLRKKREVDITVLSENVSGRD